MATIVKPSREVLFSDIAKTNPRAFPFDRLDSQIQNLIDAIHSTQIALSEVRRDDGQPRLTQAAARQHADFAMVEAQLIETSEAVAAAAAQVSKTSRDTHLRVKDAEIASFASLQSLAEIERQGAAARDAFSDVENAADRSEFYATQSQNSANYSQAQTDNAIKANIEATQWAEYLAGPVVNSADAPAYIAGHPFGHGLYYQPVEGYGGNAGLWSAKWWAVYAAQLVGAWNFYYLGSWISAPVPGSTNPATGVKVPSPLAPGSFYYNTEEHQLYVWDGTQWNPPFVQVLTPGYQSSYVYIATAGQTVFSGPDHNGDIPVVGINSSDVHVNGLRLLYGTGYTVNASTDALTLATAPGAGATVQWDMLISRGDEALTVVMRKVTIAPAPDGANTAFTMTWFDPDNGTQPVDTTSGQQLQVSLDGIVQEPGTDFVATGAALTMATAPQLNSRLWALWFAAGEAETPVLTPPFNTSLPTISGFAAQGSMLTATPGGWAGSPPLIYAYQWKSAGANVGLNQTTYTTVAGDVGKTITVTVTATNSVSSASATSAAFGPVVAAGDSIPNPFTFTDVVNQPLTTTVESNTIMVTGIDTAANLTISGGEYSKNGTGYVSSPTTVVAGDQVKVRGVSSPLYSTTTNVVLTIGGVSDTFSITTAVALDTTPDPFVFTDVSNIPLNTVTQSPNTITVTGITAPANMTVANGEYSKNGLTYASAATTVVAGDNVRVRGTSSTLAGTAVNVTLTIGGVSDVFTITTTAAVSTNYTAAYLSQGII